MQNNGTDLDLMVRAYVECALWSSTDEDGTPLDARYGPGDIAPATLDEMRADCADFLESLADDLANMDPGQAGHDFWLTRNRHGAGFWDRGLGELGDWLTANAYPYGDFNLYVGEDGLIHA